MMRLLVPYVRPFPVWVRTPLNDDFTEWTDWWPSWFGVRDA
jgi:hypothetical protein